MGVGVILRAIFNIDFFYSRDQRIFQMLGESSSAVIQRSRLANEMIGDLMLFLPKV